MFRACRACGGHRSDGGADRAGTAAGSHYCRAEDLDEAFYRTFAIVVAGVDSIQARRWINGMLVSLVERDATGAAIASTVIPLIDGGSEGARPGAVRVRICSVQALTRVAGRDAGMRGQVRVIYPGVSACFECGIDLFAPQVTYPLCTIASTPRLPEHCIEYAKVVQWPKEHPGTGGSRPLPATGPAYLMRGARKMLLSTPMIWRT